MCPPPLEVGRSSDRLGAVMRGICQYGIGDDEFANILRRILHDGCRAGEDSSDSFPDREPSHINSCGACLGRSFTPLELQDEEYVQEIIDELITEGDGETTVENSRGGSTLDMYLLPLPKRGRDYDDVWRETDYLENSSHLRKTLRPIADWSELLNCYCDSHDGYYRDWSVSHQQLPKTKFPPPPPPVQLQHPACWGRRSGGRINPESIHPASSSSTMVFPPGTFADNDLDDLDIEYERLQFLLLRQEMINFIRLRRLSSLVRSDTMLQPIKDRCRWLEENLVRIHGSVINAQRPVKAKAQDGKFTKDANVSVRAT